jgi:CHAT domain-containing protein
LYEDKLNLIQESLIVVNNIESNSLLYDILLFRKGLLLSTEVIKNNKSEDSNFLNSSPDVKNNSGDARTIDISADEIVPSMYSWLDIKNNLTKESIAIEFIASKDLTDSNKEYYNALVISDDCIAPILIEIGFISCLSNFSDGIYNSSVLYSSIWQPILRQFPNVKDIYFSADGSFHKTAIENIELPSGRLLKEKYNLHRVSSTKILTNHFSKNTMTSNVFYGGLFYDGDLDSLKYMNPSNKTRSISADSLTSMKQLRGVIRYLPGSKREVESINAQMDASNIRYSTFVGYEGTELSFRGLQGSNINILHLATHGFFREDNSSNNFDFRFLNDMKRQNFDFEDELLLNSGLFFAYANSSISLKSNLPKENDGILTAKDLTKMDFSSIDLVVLSACQTGLGTIKGEGVFGLQRGFKVSGAITLLMSLWPVDDDATQLLMVYFYKNLLNNKTKDESLMIAQNTLRSTAGFDDPDYWAGWILLDGVN